MSDILYSSEYPEATRREGLVAFLDILDYSSIQSTPSVAGHVFGVIDEVWSEMYRTEGEANPKNVLSEEDRITCGIDEKEQAIFDKIEALLHERLSISVISDSFICIADMTGLNEDEQSAVGTIFVRMLSALYSKMFIDWLPVRGGVTYGDFYCNKLEINKATAFLGRTIIDAHALESKVKAACIVVDNKAEKVIANCYSRKVPGVGYPAHYADLCQAKVTINKEDCIRQEFRVCINADSMLYDSWANIEDQLVEFAFSGFGKSVDNAEVKAKMNNTVDFLRNRTWDGKEELQQLIQQRQPNNEDKEMHKHKFCTRVLLWAFFVAVALLIIFFNFSSTSNTQKRAK